MERNSLKSTMAMDRAEQNKKCRHSSFLSVVAGTFESNHEQSMIKIFHNFWRNFKE